MSKSRVEKLTSRERAKMRIRRKISGTNERPRISVFRSERFVYAQAISDESGRTLVSASSRESAAQAITSSVELPEGSSRSTKSAAAALAVGQLLAQRLIEAGVTGAVFDRNGYVYHGRVRAVAEGARSAGLQI